MINGVSVESEAFDSPKRSNSTIENRKRSLAQSSDDEVRRFVDQLQIQ